MGAARGGTGWRGRLPGATAACGSCARRTSGSWSPGFARRWGSDLTRRLVDVAQDVFVSEDDCGTIDGIYVSAIMEGGDILEPLRDRIVGRVSQEEIYDPMTGELLLDIGQVITVPLAATIQAVSKDCAGVKIF